VVGVRPELADNSETFDAVECFGASDVRRTDARKALYVNRHFSFGNTSAVTLGVTLPFSNVPVAPRIAHPNRLTVAVTDSLLPAPHKLSGAR
jgi:hypothetical protein